MGGAARWFVFLAAPVIGAADMGIATILKKFWGAAAPEGIVLVNKAAGFNVALSTTAVAGAYVLSVQASGSDPVYPAEDAARKVFLDKSPSQFGTGLMIGTALIPADHDYARVEVQLTAPYLYEAEPDDAGKRPHLYTGPMRKYTEELCVLLHVRDARGVEKLWGVMGIGGLRPPVASSAVSRAQFAP